MSDIDQQLAELTRRVVTLEDELAIRNIIVSYGFAVDTGDASRTAELFAPEATYDIDVMEMRGRAEIAEMVAGERHQSLLPDCAHTIGPIRVELHDDRAIATGYSRLYLRKSEQIDLWRLSFNRWEMHKRDGRWLITKRSTRVLGHPEAAALFRES